MQRKTDEEVLIKSANGGPSIALIFPNDYSSAVANLGFNSVYAMALLTGFRCERFVYNKEKNSQLRSIEHNRLLTDFDVWAFSVSFELDVLNVLSVFQKTHISALSCKRNGSPLVIVGGAMTFFNPNSLWSVADVIFHGEIEGCTKFFEKMYSLLDQGMRGEKILEELSGMSCLSIPTFGVKKVVLSKLKDLKKSLAESFFLSRYGAFGKRYLIEIERGCKRGCRFCVAGYVYRPMRYMELEEIKKRISSAIEYTKKLGLVAATVTDYPYLDELLDWMEDKIESLSVSSLRLDALTPKLINSLVDFGEREITIAPETGSQRLRDLINKKISESDIEQAIRYVKKSGLKRVKMYFMYGLPEEKRGDLDGIIDIVKNVKISLMLPYVSFNPFIPKPWTPFEDFKMLDEKELKQRQRYLSSTLGKMHVKFKFESVRLSRIQWVISTASPELSEELAKTDAPFEVLKSVEKSWVPHRSWGYINGMEKSFLDSQKEMAFKFKTYPDCQIGECEACGVCEKINNQGGIRSGKKADIGC